MPLGIRRARAVCSTAATLHPLRTSRAAFICVLFAAASTFAAPPVFEVSFDRDVRTTPYTGRVFVVLSADPYTPPLQAFDWFTHEPFAGRDVVDWQPEQVVELTAENTVAYPASLAELKPGEYRVRAVVDLNGWSYNPINAPGNGISRVHHFTYDPQATEPVRVRLRISRTLPPLDLPESDRDKFVAVRSPLLSEFHHRDVYLRAGVHLPPEYAEQPDRRFPAVYVIGGFTSTLNDWPMYVGMYGGTLGAVDFPAVMVYLDADCPNGHSVFANSANNGPVGTALVTELIPELERQFRLLAEPRGRFVTGISSGGWSSLWLQIQHPDVFGGVWSVSPDPVDFRDLMGVNIYAPHENMLKTEDGAPRKLSRTGPFGPPLDWRDFTQKELAAGRGGQLYSFDAVFSPRGPDGRPKFLWDRETGVIDPNVAQAWKKYDIRLILQSNWPQLGPQLAGKLHLFCGDRDDFFLEQAFYRLRDALQELGSDAHIEIVPGGSHGLGPATWLEVARQMRDEFARTSGNASDSDHPAQNQEAAPATQPARAA